MISSFLWDLFLDWTWFLVAARVGMISALVITVYLFVQTGRWGPYRKADRWGDSITAGLTVGVLAGFGTLMAPALLAALAWALFL